MGEVRVKKLEPSRDVGEPMDINRDPQWVALGRQTELVVHRKSHLPKPVAQVAGPQRVHRHFHEVPAPDKLLGHRSHRLRGPCPNG